MPSARHLLRSLHVAHWPSSGNSHWASRGLQGSLPLDAKWANAGPVKKTLALQPQGTLKLTVDWKDAGKAAVKAPVKAPVKRAPVKAPIKRAPTKAAPKQAPSPAGPPSHRHPYGRSGCGVSRERS